MRVAWDRATGNPMRKDNDRSKYLMQIVAGLVLLYLGLAAALVYLMPLRG